MNLRLLLLPAAGALLLAACGGSDDSVVYTGEPDGRIFFTTDRDGDEEIYVMAADGSGVTNLTNNPAADSEPGLDATGERIAFISTRAGARDVWTMGADGSGPSALTADPASDSRPVWSPDGATIAHYSGRDQSRGLLWLTDTESGNSGPLLDSITPSGPDVVCAGGIPTDWLSSDTVLYQGSHAAISAIQMCSVQRSGAGITAIYGDPGVATTDATLSPDGEKIAFTSNEEGQTDVYVMDRDGTDVQRLTFDPGIDRSPAWSPDGQWIVFTSEMDGDFEIYIMRPDGSDVRQLTDNDAADMMPAWAP